MSYTFLQEQGEESWAASYSDIPLYVLSRLNLTAGKFCFKGSGTESCQSSQSGMMSEPLTENLGEEKSMSSAGDSHARTYPLPTQTERDLKASVAGFGRKCGELLAKYCPDSHLLKTAQCLLFGGGQESLETLPHWGMLADGELWEVGTPTALCGETGYGYLPAAVASDGKHHGKEKWIANSRAKRAAVGKSPPTEKITYAYYEADIAPKYFPEISEDVMHWPIGWTDLRPLVTAKIQQWLRLHGESLEGVPHEMA